MSEDSTKYKLATLYQIAQPKDQAHAPETADQAERIRLDYLLNLGQKIDALPKSPKTVKGIDKAKSICEDGIQDALLRVQQPPDDKKQ